jgi:hypothetical protein
MKNFLKKIIPFSFWPGHWGLSGVTREIAYLDYTVSNPCVRELAKLNLEIREMTVEKRRSQLSIELFYNVITKKQYQSLYIETISDEIEKKQKTLQFLYEDDEITEYEYNKELATIEGKLWFKFDVNYNTLEGELELDVDWNSQYIDFLRENGYTGDTEDDVIETYMRDFGRKLSTNDDYEIES